MLDASTSAMRNGTGLSSSRSQTSKVTGATSSTVVTLSSSADATGRERAEQDQQRIRTPARPLGAPDREELEESGPTQPGDDDHHPQQQEDDVPVDAGLVRVEGLVGARRSRAPRPRRLRRAPRRRGAPARWRSAGRRRRRPRQRAPRSCARDARPAAPSRAVTVPSATPSAPATTSSGTCSAGHQCGDLEQGGVVRHRAQQVRLGVVEDVLHGQAASRSASRSADRLVDHAGQRGVVLDVGRHRQPEHLRRREHRQRPAVVGDHGQAGQRLRRPGAGRRPARCRSRGPGRRAAARSAAITAAGYCRNSAAGGDVGHWYGAASVPHHQP